LADAADPPTVAGALRWLTLALIVSAVLFNGVLAAINGNVFPVSRTMVIICELGIFAGIALVLAATRIHKSDWPAFALLFTMVIIALLISIGEDRLYPDQIRNYGIIALFTLLGSRCDEALVRKAFAIVSVVVLLFLILELASLPTYTALFHPASYFEQTRGVEQRDFNDTGLFASTLGYAGRFSYGIFNAPRTSSIFVEQVSLAGFATVLEVFLLGFWQRLSNPWRVLHTALIILILLSNNARAASTLCVLGLIGYFAYPRLPRYFNLLLAPLLLLGSLSFLDLFNAFYMRGDNLVGRLGVSWRALYSIDFRTLLTGAIDRSVHMLDAGYAYVIMSTTIFGLIAFWLYASLIVPQTTAPKRRVAWGLALYLFSWLLIGGTAVFTIKTASLIWLLAGFMRRSNEPHSATDSEIAELSGRRAANIRLLRPARTHSVSAT